MVYARTFSTAFEIGGPSAAADEFRNYFPADPHVAHIDQLLQCMVDNSIPMPLMGAMSPQDRLFLENFNAIRGGVCPRNRGLILEVGKEFDFLDGFPGTNYWSIFVHLNLLAMKQIRLKGNVAAFIVVRDEGIFLLEWIAHTLAIGIEKIFILTDGNTDLSDDLLVELAKHNIIHLMQNDAGQDVVPQLKAYTYAIHFLPELREYEWVFFIDCDEFVMPAPKYNYDIQAFVHDVRLRFPGELPVAVVFPWNWRLSNGEFSRTSELVLRRFSHSVPHRFVKSMVRLHDIIGHYVHQPDFEPPGFMVETNFQKIETHECYDEYRKSFEGGHIEHYWNKSFEEFVVKKQRTDGLPEKFHDRIRSYESFFAWDSPIGEENLNPVPEVVIQRMEHMLGIIRSHQRIAECEAASIGLFSSRSQALKSNSDLLALYESLCKKIEPTQAPAPARPRKLEFFGPVIHIQPAVDLGCRMMQFMAALTLSEAVPGSAISNIDFREWCIAKDNINSDGRNTISVSVNNIDVVSLAEALNGGAIDCVEINAPCAHMANFLPSEAYSRAFFSGADVDGFGDDVLVCHLQGHDALAQQEYVALPLEFYAEVAAITGLRLVFLGLDQAHPYHKRICERFPQASCLSSEGIIKDFERLRRSMNVLPAVTPLSWLAAWLSEARCIILPMVGYFNPFQTKDVDLLPLDDRRYKFFLFPLTLPSSAEEPDISCYPADRGWRLVTAEMIRELRRSAPRFGDEKEDLAANFNEAYYLTKYPDVKIAVDRERCSSGLEHFLCHGYSEGRETFGFDPGWYLRQYPLAALEVGQGDFGSLRHHYVAVGRLRGYLPEPRE